MFRFISDSLALIYADESLKNDREIVLAALNSTDTKGIQYFSRYINSDLLEDPEIKELMNKEN